MVNGARYGVVSFGDKVAFTFSNCYKEDNIEKGFFRRLGEMGIPVTVLTDRGDAFGGVESVINEDGCTYPDKVFIPTRKDRKSKPVKHRIVFRERLERVFHV